MKSCLKQGYTDFASKPGGRAECLSSLPKLGTSKRREQGPWPLVGQGQAGANEAGTREMTEGTPGRSVRVFTLAIGTRRRGWIED